VKLSLPEVTLVAIDDVAHDLVRLSIEDTLTQIEPHQVLLWTDRLEAGPPGVQCLECRQPGSIAEYHRILWQEVPSRIETSHFLVIQWDGWVLDAGVWTDEFLTYDYIGAPWGWHFVQRVGNGGFSLRSAKLARFLAASRHQYPPHHPEDDTLCRVYRSALEQIGYRWAPEGLAKKFSVENGPVPIDSSFGFHDCRNWPRVLAPERIRERVALASDYVRNKMEFHEMLVMAGIDLDNTFRQRDAPIYRTEPPEQTQRRSSRLDPERPVRPVGWESRKSYGLKIANGFFDRYLSGRAILEIGYKGSIDRAVPIVPQAIGIDLDYPGYDGATLPFADESQDAVYTSHCFQHISDYKHTIREWFRVLKTGGHLVIIVPHQYLFERRRKLPSRVFGHKRFYTPASLLLEIEEVLEPNSYRVRHLVDNDFGFDYSVLPGQSSVVGCYEIELVLEKIHPPCWTIDGDLYSTAEFQSHVLPDVHPFFLQTDFSVTDTCIVYGPYVRLPPGEHEATFHIKATGLGDQDLASPITFDVAQNMTRIASVEAVGLDGNNLLRNEKVTLRFRNNNQESLFEFRIFTEGRPFHGTFVFFGVSLRRL
jgi:SAM-dependent methyltransferase